MIVGVAAGGGVALLAATGFIIVKRRKVKSTTPHHPSPPPPTPPSISPPPPPPPQHTRVMLEDVTIGKQIGAGHFGKVYLGTWQGVDVALKTVSVDKSSIYATRHTQHAEFEKEASMLQQLNHPNIVRFFGIYEAGQTCIQISTLQLQLHTTTTKNTIITPK